jgi:hypothetical protein
MDPIIIRGVGTASTVSVTTAILRIFGDSSWASTVNPANRRRARNGVIVTNTSTADPIFVSLIDADLSTSGTVSSTNYTRRIGPLECETFLVGQGVDLVVVRPTGAAANVTAQEIY